jgi:hypothetical protein
MQTIPCNNQPCPINCQMGTRNTWRACQGLCGLGISTTTRPILQNGAYDESFCECWLTPCDADCLITDWNDWSICTAVCGGGQMTRTRSVIKQGTRCPYHLFESAPCNSQPSCKVGPFGNWSTCSESCGTGIQPPSHNSSHQWAVGLSLLDRSQRITKILCPLTVWLVLFKLDFMQRLMWNWTATARSHSIWQLVKLFTVMWWRNYVITPSQNGGKRCGRFEDFAPCFTTVSN